jgi:hypothetical protein
MLLKLTEAAMNTFLVTTQILCYGVGILSASLNVAIVVRRHRARWRRRRERAA